LATGAILGGIGLLNLRKQRTPLARDIAAAGLNARLKRVEHSMANVATDFKDYMSDSGVEYRINRAQRRIRQARRSAENVPEPRRANWIGRIADAIRHAV
jgi:hypothetical protein